MKSIYHGEMWLSYWHGQTFLCVYKPHWTLPVLGLSFHHCPPPKDSPWPSHTCSFICKGCLGTQSFSFLPFTEHLSFLALQFCFAQTGEVGLSKASSCALGERVREGHCGSWARITHAQSQPARLESPAAWDSLLMIHKTIAEINIFPL